MQIEYVVHASLLLTSNKRHLLLDPFSFIDPVVSSFLCHYPSSPKKASEFPILDYIYCSHVHDDHCHDYTLQKLKNKIKTIILPAGKTKLEEKVRRLGFTNIVFLEPEITKKFGDFRLTAYFDKNGTDTALIIEAEGKTLFHQNDCPLDTATFKRMAKRFKIDYDFSSHTGIQEIFALLLPRPVETILNLRKKQEKQILKRIINGIKILKPKVVIPYAYTFFYINEDQKDLNGFCRTTPYEFKKEVLKDLPKQKVLILQPGDQINTNKKASLQKISKINLWGKTLKEYIEQGNNYVAAKSSLQKKFSLGKIVTIEENLIKYMENRLKKPFPKLLSGQTIALQIYDENDKKTFYLDPSRKYFGTEAPSYPFLEIKMPASILGILLSRQYDTFAILFSYRISFQLNASAIMNLSDFQECYLYINVYASLFDED